MKSSYGHLHTTAPGTKAYRDNYDKIDWKSTGHVMDKIADALRAELMKKQPTWAWVPDRGRVCIECLQSLPLDAFTVGAVCSDCMVMGYK